jgi:predicted NAD/FAD-dependent oxidoreductase
MEPRWAHTPSVAAISACILANYQVAVAKRVSIAHAGQNHWASSSSCQQHTLNMETLQRPRQQQKQLCDVKEERRTGGNALGPPKHSVVM